MKAPVVVGAALVVALLAAASWWLLSTPDAPPERPGEVVGRPEPRPPRDEPVAPEPFEPTDPAGGVGPAEPEPAAAVAPPEHPPDEPTNAALGVERPETRAVALMLYAARRRDAELLRRVYSPRIAERVPDWGRLALEVSIAFERVYGDYAADEFSYRYVGGAHAGQVEITHRGERQGTARVVRADGRWYVDEP